MKKIIFLEVLVILISAYATSYQADSLTGGFSETQLGENIFQVSFRGNAYTRKNRATDFTLLRSAELTLEHGFRYFIITESEKDTTVVPFTTPTHSHTTGSAYVSGNYIYGSANTTTSGGHTFLMRKPTTTNTIVCFREKPEINNLVDDAKFVAASIKKKYGLTKNLD